MTPNLTKHNSVWSTLNSLSDLCTLITASILLQKLNVSPPFLYKVQAVTPYVPMGLNFAYLAQLLPSPNIKCSHIKTLSLITNTLSYALDNDVLAIRLPAE